MKCLRCGYCCCHLMVTIVDNPELEDPIVEGNIIANMGNGVPCKHLEGSKAGEYSCKIHNKKWYVKTPCYSHGQIENYNSECRIGKYILAHNIEIPMSYK